MLRFAEHDDFIELGLDSQESADLPSRGDAYMTVIVSSAGFTGHNDLWVTSNDLHEFCTALVALERTRRGEAVLQGVVPEELWIRVRSVNSRGHMEVEGHLGYHVQRENSLPWHAVHFGFEFDPSQLLKAVSVDWVRRNAL